MNWCSAACAASIFNYRFDTNLTAKNVIVEMYNRVKDGPIPDNDIISIGERKGLTMNKYLPLSNDEVKSHIGADDPIMMLMKERNGLTVDHAVLLIGYDRSHNFLINPWYNSRNEQTDRYNTGSSLRYYVDGYEYKWDRSIIDWY